jgi:hypothetical protein
MERIYRGNAALCLDWPDWAFSVPDKVQPPSKDDNHLKTVKRCTTTAFDAVPVVPPARPSSSVSSGAFPSLATLYGSAKSTLVPYSINPTVHANRTLDGDAVHGELFTFDKHDAAESRRPARRAPRGIRGNSARTSS